MEPSTGLLRGSVVPIVTPLNADLTFDAGACRAMAEDLIGSGVSGLVALGTTGELGLVPPAIRLAMLETLGPCVAGRVPLIACCGSPSPAETEREVREAAAAGADYALVVPSFYLSIGPDEILRQFEALRAISAVPLLYYHIPVRSGARGGAGIVAALHEAGLIAGLKDSGGFAPDFAEAMLELRARDAGFQILLGGSSKFLQAAAFGIEAVTSVTGCIAPDIERRLLEYLGAGRVAEAAAEQRKLVQLVQLILSANPENAAVGGKALLFLLGRCGPLPLPPFVAATKGWMDRARPQLEALCTGADGTPREMASLRPAD